MGRPAPGIFQASQVAKDIFADIAELGESERAAELDRACVGNMSLREEVVNLLAVHDEAASRGFMGAPTAHGKGDKADETGTLSPLVEGAGTRIGPYKLLQQIGEGGFGAVFMAEQQEPVVRRVALKIIRVGMDTRQVIARFEAERQALAMMDHPNIAKALDAGATATGRPYFVMELVRGEPITSYCDREKLSVPERLELFIQVCHAVQHAHQKGIIHRDIKPSNVLVTVHDGKPVPKVIDFGIAKATISRLTEKTLFTEHRALIGTPEYMSPEQADMGATDIDTRSDIYSLGVLLYELLTGVTPLDAKALRSAAFAEMQRIIREQDPPKPSTRLSTLDTLSSVAAQRTTEPRRLGALVRGDLDWIVMKCLEKDRSRRYETANGLAADVQRHLAGEAVVAVPPSTVYRMRKFARRHRATVLAVGAVATALVLGTGVSATFAVRERAARGREAEQRLAAERHQQETERVAKFQASMLAGMDSAAAATGLVRDLAERYDRALSETGVGAEERASRVAALRDALWRADANGAAQSVIVENVLKPAETEIDRQFEDQPLVQAGLRQTIADVYAKLGRPEEAMPLQRSALEVRRRLLGNDHPDTLDSVSNTGCLLRDQGKNAEAEPYFQEALDKWRARQNENPRLFITALGNVGALRQQQGNWKEAETLSREALERYRALNDPAWREGLTAIANLSAVLHMQGKREEALPLCREAYEKRRAALGENDPDTIESMANLGTMLQDDGQLNDAEPLLKEAVERARHALGDDHPTTLSMIAGLGNFMIVAGRLTEAEPLVREAVDRRSRVLGPKHPETLASTGSLAMVLQNLGRYKDAERYFEQAWKVQRELYGDDHPETIATLGNYAIILWYERKLDRAAACASEALERSRRVRGNDHPGTMALICNMGTILSDQSKFAEAEKYQREGLLLRREKLGDEHPDTAISMNNLGFALQAQGKYADALPLFEESLKVRTRALGPEHPDTLVAVCNVGYVLMQLGKLEEATPYYERALEQRTRVLGEHHPDTLISKNNMAFLLLKRKQHTESEKMYKEVLDEYRARYGEDHPATLSAKSNLGALYQTMGELALAEPLYREALQKRIDQFGPAHPDTITSMNNLGSLLGMMGSFEEGEKMLLAAHAAAEALPPTHPLHKKLAKNLGDLYEAWEKARPGEGHGEKAAAWKAKLAALEIAAP